VPEVVIGEMDMLTMMVVAASTNVMRLIERFV
jgi:hypothetical protein